MRKIIYFIEYILIKILFFIFKLIGYKFSSNLGFKIGIIFGPLFKSKKSIINNLEKANIQKQENLKKIASNVLGKLWKNFCRIYSPTKFRNDKLRKYISIEGIEHLNYLKKFKKKAIFVSGHFNNFELMAMQIEKGRN
jgi:KDO2-lipid IV(A) lauroyltransferase